MIPRPDAGLLVRPEPWQPVPIPEDCVVLPDGSPSPSCPSIVEATPYIVGNRRQDAEEDARHNALIDWIEETLFPDRED